MSLMPFSRTGEVSDAGYQISIAVVALALMAGGMTMIGFWLASGAPQPPPVRNPFGVGPREVAPSANGLGALIIEWQAWFYRKLTSGLNQLKDSPAALPALLGLGFGYGVVHAAGPGHGKAVISAYILADDRSVVWRGFSLSLAAAFVQAFVAIGVVLVFTILLRATALSMNDATRWIEMASFAAVALLGLVILWRKAGVLIAAWRGEEAACAPGCAHDAAMIAPTTGSWRATAGVVLAAGIRPCAGALIVLVFAASQGLLWAGVATTFAMALGTALTTGAIALVAVTAKQLALRLAGGRGQRAAIVVRAFECLAAAFVAVFGGLLLFGYWAAGAG